MFCKKSIVRNQKEKEKRWKHATMLCIIQQQDIFLRGFRSNAKNGANRKRLLEWIDVSNNLRKQK